VSINDVELSRLGMLMNEIFGEDNWLGTLVWKGNTDNNPTRIAIEHEYILCYAKNKSQLPTQWVNRSSEVKTLMLDTFARLKAEAKSPKALAAEFQRFAAENKAILGDLYRYRRVDAHGPYAARRNLDNPGKPGHKYKVIHPATKKSCKMPVWGWRYTETRMKQLIAEGRILFGKDQTQIPQLKVYLEEVAFPLRSVIELDARSGSNDLEDLFGSRDVFKNPKPVELMRRLLDYTTRPDSLVLDAFAGSGTTGHAVLSLNKDDGGKRRFILIEEGRGKNGRDRFCRTLTAPRIAKAVKKYKYNDGFVFLTAGRKLDRQAIVSLERDALANLICQADETGRGRSITRLMGHKYVIGKNPRNEGICLVWRGEADSEVSPEHLKQASAEVTAVGLKRPFRIYGTFCRVADTSSWRFCQIPDEIIAQMHIEEEAAEIV
jgi:adenine-specific DNA-methyltransferase